MCYDNSNYHIFYYTYFQSSCVYIIHIYNDQHMYGLIESVKINIKRQFFFWTNLDNNIEI